MSHAPILLGSEMDFPKFEISAEQGLRGKSAWGRNGIDRLSDVLPQPS
jgi:hypothetical protein